MPRRTANDQRVASERVFLVHTHLHDICRRRCRHCLWRKKLFIWRNFTNLCRATSSQASKLRLFETTTHLITDRGPGVELLSQLRINVKILSEEQIGQISCMPAFILYYTLVWNCTPTPTLELASKSRCNRKAWRATTIGKNRVSSVFVTLTQRWAERHNAITKTAN